MTTIEDLTTPITEDDALATLLNNLTQLGFQATSWQSGSIQLTFLKLIAMVWAAVSVTIATIATAGFTSLANVQYVYLSLIATYWYQITPISAQNTVGEILITSSPTAGSTTFAVGDIIISDQPNGTAGANTYTNTEGGTLGPDATLLVEFKADIAGASANIPPNTTLYLWTAGFVGLTVTNPVVAATSTWITSPGVDQESAARLATRCLLKWSALTYGNTDGAYKFWAMTALPTLTRLEMLDAPGDGTVTLVGANALGPISGADITTIEDYVNGVDDGIGRRPINDIFTAVAATTVTTPALTVTVYCLPTKVATITGDATTALLSYIGSVPIGGTVLTGTQGRVLYSDMLAIVQDLSGVISVTMSITSDVLLSAGQIYAPAITVNPISVAPVV